LAKNEEKEVVVGNFMQARDKMIMKIMYKCLVVS
jgi:hypothetical protein